MIDYLQRGGDYISNLIIPIIVLYIIVFVLIKKVDIYNVFIEGAKESFDISLTMFPCLLGMIFGVNIFLKSNVIFLILGFNKELFNLLNISIDIFPMIIMKPISGSASLAILNSIFENFGPDSFIGRLASIMQGSSDTTFYIITLYFGSVGIKKIKYALWAGLFADLIGVILSILAVHLFF